jgi:hypothetical protein
MTKHGSKMTESCARAWVGCVGLVGWARGVSGARGDCGLGTRDRWLRRLGRVVGWFSGGWVGCLCWVSLSAIPLTIPHPRSV